MQNTDGVVIKCNIHDKVIDVKYVTGRKLYTCDGCDKSIEPKTDYYYVNIEKHLISVGDADGIPHGMSFNTTRSFVNHYHTECFPDRRKYKKLELKKARELFNKL